MVGSKQESQIRYGDRGVALITGGGSGIGRALGLELGRRGMHVVLADIEAGDAEETAAGVIAAGGSATAAELDVRDFPAFDALVAQIFQNQGRLDLIFNNAGIAIGGEARDYELDDWDRIFDVNLRGVAHGVQAAYGRMIEQGFGHIVNTASLAGLVVTPMIVGYTATKHAVVGLSRSLRAEAGAYGIRVSVVCPGAIRTPILYGGKHGKMIPDLSRETQEAIWERLKPQDPQVLARNVLKSLRRNRAIIVEPKWYRLIWWLDRLSVPLGDLLGRAVFHDARKTFERS